MLMPVSVQVFELLQLGLFCHLSSDFVFEPLKLYVVGMMLKCASGCM
jgi:hypothetical protein